MRRFAVALLAILLFGFGVTLLKMEDISSSMDALASTILPHQIILSPDPLEVSMQTQPCVTLKKVVNEIEITYECCKQAGETNQEWGARCAKEFMEFCDGFGE